MSNPADVPPLFHSEAEQEYLEAVRWYADRSPRVAAEFIDAVEGAVQSIIQAPRRYPAGIAGTRTFLLRRFRYRVVYRIVHDELIQVVAIAHTSRRPGYWQDRA